MCRQPWDDLWGAHLNIRMKVLMVCRSRCNMRAKINHLLKSMWPFSLVHRYLDSTFICKRLPLASCKYFATRLANYNDIEKCNDWLACNSGLGPQSRKGKKDDGW